jgi:hypothetical protein
MTGREVSDDAKIFTFRAGRSFLVGVFAMGAVAWIVSVPAVLAAAVAAGTTAVMTARAARFRTLVMATLTLAVVGALTGSLLFGHGPLALRIIAGLVASLAAGPWGVVLGMIVRARALRR